MVKDSAEGNYLIQKKLFSPHSPLSERIMQIGKKKLVLDHLIVQKMDDDEDNGGENIQSILTYGAQALFEGDQEARDITCKASSLFCCAPSEIIRHRQRY